MNQSTHQTNFIFIGLNSLLEAIICLLPGLILGSSLKWYSGTVFLLFLYLWLSKAFINLLREAFKNHADLTNQLLAFKLAIATILIFLLFFKLGFNFTLIVILYELYQMLVRLNFNKFLVHTQYTFMMSFFNGFVFNCLVLALAKNKFEFHYFYLFTFAFLVALSTITTKQLYDYNGSWNKKWTILFKLISFLATIGLLFWQSHTGYISDWLFYALAILLVVVLFCLKLIVNPKKREMALHLSSIILLIIYYVYH
ncbi:hypothetical protein ACWN8B_08635 [Vagococcus zengguangii]|uniref:Uncharacterized protein n=1 Tax=Vagococcus zengguangii TaxID=2571750 RepID=A0A4D7CTZ8_9ENTE|nr:hypothetical protein [Vagococcus zengguangii]QCI86743.1 hypothetical protein FA707_07085 [Vagococcus zengguangii]